MRNEVVEELERLATADKNVIGLLADNGLQVFDRFQENLPSQLINVGIAEANLVGVSAGLAAVGYVPFAYTILPFIAYRAFEFLRNDVCYQNLNVKLIGVGAGWAYSTLGPTHHGTEDLALVRTLENLTVLSPADPSEAVLCLKTAYEKSGPVYLRIGKGKEPELPMHEPFVFGKLRLVSQGTGRILVLSTGSVLVEAIAAKEALGGLANEVTIVNVHTIKPFDSVRLLQLAKNAKAILTLEEHSIAGGLGGLVSECLAESEAVNPPVRRLGLRDSFMHSYGSVNDLRKKAGLTSEQVKQNIQQMAAQFL